MRSPLTNRSVGRGQVSEQVLLAVEVEFGMVGRDRRVGDDEVVVGGSPEFG